MLDGLAWIAADADSEGLDDDGVGDGGVDGARGWVVEAADERFVLGGEREAEALIEFDEVGCVGDRVGPLAGAGDGGGDDEGVLCGEGDDGLCEGGGGGVERKIVDGGADIPAKTKIFVCLVVVAEDCRDGAVGVGGEEDAEGCAEGHAAAAEE